MSPAYAGPPQANPNGTSHYDATADFAQTLADPQRWIIKKGVPIFKAHQRTDPNTQKLIRVDLPKLYRIADNLQRLERDGGVPVRLTLGHTEPGKPENQQPPVAGYYRNARVQPFGPKGEPAVVVDEWLDPQYAGSRKNFPYRSAEYYDDSEQITGVALLTRDPYLDLGVVAYSRLPGELASFTVDSKVPAPVRYERGVLHRPVMYSLVVTEVPSMYPPAAPNTPAPASPTASPPAAPPYTPPTPTPYTGVWPGPPHQRHNIGHPHPSGGAVYGAGMYGPSAPPPMGGGPSMGGMGGPSLGGMGGPSMGGGGDPMSALRDCLMQAVQIVSGLAGGGMGGGPSMGGMPPTGSAPTSPFPSTGGGSGGSGGGSEPTMSSRQGARRGYAPRGRGDYYAQPAARAPMRYGPDARTISGLPLGYQMALDARDAEIRQLKEQMQVVFYERNQADTEACAAEIQRLAAAGYQVGEYEFNELKKKAKPERAAYLQHVMARYAKGPGTEPLPPVLGDPTPEGSPTPDLGGPATQEEVEMALRMTEGDTSPASYMRALEQVRYMRAGGGAPAQPTPYNRLPGRTPPPFAADPTAAFAWQPGAPAPVGPGAFRDPYEANGFAGY